MFTILFDKGLDTERVFSSTDYNEIVGDNLYSRFNYSVNIEESGIIPDMTPFRDNPYITSINVVTETGSELPLIGKYNYINAIHSNASSKKYSISMIVINKNEEPIPPNKVKDDEINE